MHKLSLPARPPSLSWSTVSHSFLGFATSGLWFGTWEYVLTVTVEVMVFAIRNLGGLANLG